MRAHPSIRHRLLVMLISSILLIWLIVLLLVYRVAEHEVEEVFDADLARSARILHSLLLHEIEDDLEMSTKAQAVLDELGSNGMQSHPRLMQIMREYMSSRVEERLKAASPAEEAGHRYGSGLAFVARYADGKVMMRDQGGPDIPPLGDGFANLQLGEEAWRVFGLTDSSTGFVVQVGERQAIRGELVRYITRNTLMPLLLALPMLAIFVWIAVGQALRPLQRVAQEVERRAPDALDAIDNDDSPYEVHSLLAALNRLFDRVRSAMQRERQFTADAAHELRTPLAGLKTHLQVALAQSTEPAIRRSIDQALDGVDRATHSVEQLLLLARADAEQTRVLMNAKVDLREIATWAVAMLSQQAFQRDIDLGVDAPGAAVVHGDASALQVMLRNLVDNAVRYTPVGGTVTVVVRGDGEVSWIAVLDNGAGVAVGERERIFDRFHRGADELAQDATGSGLGLSIVQRIADLHGARIELDQGLDGVGLGVRVIFGAHR